MPNRKLPIVIILQTLNNDNRINYLAEAMMFPEVLRFSDDENDVKNSLKANLKKTLEGTAPDAIYQYVPPVNPKVREISVTVVPPKTLHHDHTSQMGQVGHSGLKERKEPIFWREPITLNIPIVEWKHLNSGRIAYIPSLQIQIAATDAKTQRNFDEAIAENIRAALSRYDAIYSLKELSRLTSLESIKLEHDYIEVDILTTKQTAVRDQTLDESKKSVLNQIGRDLTKEKLPQAYETEKYIKFIVEALTGRHSQSVLLTGKSGTGKTALVYELVRRREELGLGDTPFWETGGSRLVAGMSGFGQWQERCANLVKEASKTKSVIYLGNLVELNEVGRSILNNQGIASFLCSYIARGDLTAIAECTPEQLSLLEQKDPRLLEAFHQIKIDEPSKIEIENILLNTAVDFCKSSEATEIEIETEVIERIDQLHRRYASYSAYPGRPVMFLKNLLTDHFKKGSTNPTNLAAEDVTSQFSKQTGLPKVLLDEREVFNLDTVRSFFNTRVMGQSDAVDSIIELLSTVKAMLLRPHKPIASLLFIGPTGTGKTETAKTLAEFLYQNRTRMIRFDMSEFSDEISVGRLIGEVSSGEGLLTSKIREHPFSVLLFDEFEKAHPRFFDLLLQVLGEGRLTDARGNTADFSNSVVIMTSNLGSETFQSSTIGFGHTGNSAAAVRNHFINAVRQSLRPELFNRIDKIVPFLPLDENTVLKIAEREIETIKRRDGIFYRGVGLNIEKNVTEHLARVSYDSRLGARPLKRRIERELLAPLAESLNSHSADTHLNVDVKLKGNAIAIKATVIDQDLSSLTANTELKELAERSINFRRKAQRLEASPSIINLQNDIHYRERTAQQTKKNKRKSPEEAEREAQLPRLKDVLEAVKDFSQTTINLENKSLMAIYGKSEIDLEIYRNELMNAEYEWMELLISVWSLKYNDPDTVMIGIYGDNIELEQKLAEAYFQTATEMGAAIKLYEFLNIAPSDKPSKPRLNRIEKPDEYFKTNHNGFIGFGLEIITPFAIAKFEAESGAHIFVRGNSTTGSIVQIENTTIEEYKHPKNIEQHGEWKNKDKRRIWNFTKGLIDDMYLKKKLQWQVRKLNPDMAELMDESLVQQLESLI